MALIILDRDGVINEDSDDYIRSLAEWHPAIETCEIVEIGGDTHRHLTLGDGAKVLEKLGMRAELRKDLERCRELTSVSSIGRSCPAAARRASATSANGCCPSPASAARSSSAATRSASSGSACAYSSPSVRATITS